MLPFQTENGSPGNFPKSVYRFYSSFKRKFVICPFVNEQTNGSYPSANRLSRLNVVAHLCMCMYIYIYRYNRYIYGIHINICIYIYICIYKYIYICCRFKQKTEAYAIFKKSFYHLRIVQTEVVICPFADEKQTKVIRLQTD